MNSRGAIAFVIGWSQRSGCPPIDAAPRTVSKAFDGAFRRRIQSTSTVPTLLRSGARDPARPVGGRPRPLGQLRIDVGSVAPEPGEELGPRRRLSASQIRVPSRRKASSAAASPASGSPMIAWAPSRSRMRVARNPGAWLRGPHDVDRALRMRRHTFCLRPSITST